MYSSKTANTMEIADLVATLVDSEGYNRTQLAELLGVVKSTVCQLYNLTALPDAIKGDVRAKQKVTQTELVRISKLPPDKQVLEYELAKKFASEGGKVPQAEVTCLCERMVRTATKIIQFQSSYASANKSLSASERAESLVAITALSDALFSLKSFTETNPIKRALSSFLCGLL
jgi:ParB-like chromosome segregation protein Spo0J